jgi:hypothetical protein
VAGGRTLELVMDDRHESSISALATPRRGRLLEGR